MAERLTGAILLALMSLLVALSARAGEVLRFGDDEVATEQQSLDEVRELQKIRSEIDEQTVHLYVVQFISAIQVWDRQNLETLKAKVVSYIPDDALVVRATPKIAETIRLSSPNIRVVLPYAPAWKISSELPLPSVLTKDTLVDAEIKFASDKDANRSLPLVQKLSETEILNSTSDRVTLRTSPVNLAPISKFETVVWIARPTETLSDAQPEKTKSVANFISENNNIAAPTPSLVEAAARHADGNLNLLTKALMLDELNGISLGEQHVYPINVNQRGKLLITFNYQDKDFAPIAGEPVANNLSVVVVNEKGTEISLGDSGQALKHMEINVSKGAYEIRVRGINIPAGKQPYSLIISIL